MNIVRLGVGGLWTASVRHVLGIVALSGLVTGACSSDDAPPPIAFAAYGSASAPSGQGSFRFGASSAATQIEDDNEHTDWFVWTAPPPLGLGKGTFVGEAARGKSLALEDAALLTEMNLDSYRFSMEWARIEPQRDAVSEPALAHYDRVVDELVRREIRPMVTIHHFSNPLWVDDPRDAACADGPSDTNLCGWDHPDGAKEIIAELAEHARMLATRYGDRVDDWCTLNEPINYLLASYGVGFFPPGKTLVNDAALGGGDLTPFINVVRNYIAAHAAVYRAIKEADQIDADGDGVAANVGFTLSVAEWAPARGNEPSDDPEDIAAADRVRYVYHQLFVEALRQGAFDPDIDRSFGEPHPEWKDTLDWLGVQYYFRTGVTASPPLIPKLDATVCFGGFNFGSCLEPAHPTHYVPSMHYEFYAPGLYNILADFSARWPDLPMIVSESGIATEVGARRAEHVVRSLEQIARARDEGVDVRGYYHWSLTDNFEWAEGYGPRFGLYKVDYATFARTPTEGAHVLRDIAGARALSPTLRKRHGGLGPMTEEPEP
jgi:beta-glucosidase/6-phospho-beta-glucosidase/beta-galactosidase